MSAVWVIWTLALVSAAAGTDCSIRFVECLRDRKDLMAVQYFACTGLFIWGGLALFAVSVS